MTTQEFSNEFDIQYNNIMSNQAPGLDEYEKSIFLTKAQSEIVKNYFNPKGNKYQEGFDDNSKRQYDFSSIVRTERCFNISHHIDESERLDSRSIPFIFPLNYFLLVNEVVLDSSNNRYSVLPISYEDYTLKLLKPYQYPYKRQAWRILSDRKNFNYGLKEVEYGLEPTKKKVPILVQSSYASDKRTLRFKLIYRNGAGLKGKLIEIFRTKNTYDLEEVSCYVNKISDLDLDKILRMIVTYINTPGSQLSVYIDSKVDLSHWDNFELFEFPNRIEIGDIIKLNEVQEGTSKEVFSIDTEIQYRPIAEIIGKFKDSIKEYIVRYVKTLSPIILDNLPDNLSIQGINTITECELPEEIHQEILQRAVELAKSAYQGDLNSTLELGKRSE